MIILFLITTCIFLILFIISIYFGYGCFRIAQALLCYIKAKYNDIPSEKDIMYYFKIVIKLSSIKNKNARKIYMKLFNLN